MAARLVISLDFELMWGVRDHRSVADYGDAVLGERTAIPAMLQRFSEVGIRATWAVVGLLYARNRAEMLEYAPRLRPAYRNALLSPYHAIEREIGPDEASDPLHYGRSLIDRVADVEGQEIATHTYSHYFCLEEGPPPEAFRADLESSRAIAAAAGHATSCIVFPRNQMAEEHIAECRRQGIKCFRGQPSSYPYRPRPRKEDHSFLVRGVRLLDGIAPVAGRHAFDRAGVRAGIADVPASRFLRPWNPAAPAYSWLHVDHVLREMRVAAARGQTYHLWWHPHNVGRHQHHNLAQLDRILAEFSRLRDEHGMQSVTMSDVARQDIPGCAA